MTMSSEKFSLPNHTQEEQDIFQKSFAEDFENLKTNPALTPFFCYLYATVCKMPSLSLYTEKEAQTIVQLSDPPDQQLALLKSIDDKGPQAMAIFYLLLHMTDEKAYGDLPSCTDNDEKTALMSKMRDKSIHLLQNKVSEMLHTFKPLHSQGSARPAASIATVRPLITIKKEEDDASLDTNEKKSPKKKTINEDEHSADSEEEKKSPKKRNINEDEPSDDSEEVTEEKSLKKNNIKEAENIAASEIVTEKKSPKKKSINEDENIAAAERGKPNKQQGTNNRRGWGIKKDDEFFHFLIVCFALGAVLVCEYYYSDWTVSAGIGLISFATLETFGIYFGLIYRIRTVVEHFLPLMGRFALVSKKQE